MCVNLLLFQEEVDKACLINCPLIILQVTCFLSRFWIDVDLP